MEKLTSKIESLLFISGRPMSVKELADLSGEGAEQVAVAGDQLLKNYRENNSGLRIIKIGSSYQMTTAGENAAVIQEFVKDETTGELTRPSLETLTIIAYRGPIAKTDLDRIRGINCSLILRNLLIRGLVEVKEDHKRDESYYTITFDFLRYLGLNEVKELPDYERLSKDDTIDRILQDNPLAAKMDVNRLPLDLPANSSGNDQVVVEEEEEFEDEDDGEDEEDEEESDEETDQDISEDEEDTEEN